MLIADSQVHVWEANSPRRPWHDGPVKPHMDVPLTPDRLLKEMTAAGVDRAVLVPPSWDGGRNDLVLEAAQAHPDRFAVMGRLDIDAPDAREQIANARKTPGMLGFRLSFNRAQSAPPLREGRLDWLWAAAEKAQVPIMTIVTQNMVEIIDGIAARYPGLKLVLCHLALTSGLSEEETFRDFDKLLLIARRPNVAVKASALPTYTQDVYPFRRVHPYLRRVYDAFGPKRMFWGTDLSRFKNCTYRQGVTMFTEEIPWLTTEDNEWIMARGLCEWIGWA